MMVSMTVELRNVEGTQAALGWAGSHTVVVDRPEGKAGGQGLGFNGGQLLALAIGGCFCNDLRYVAHEKGVELGRIAVSVTVDLEGDPLLATAARLNVSCKAGGGADTGEIVRAAEARCMAANSLRKGFPVTVEASVPAG
jgi:organic hydroperoxide reductase OsmC/OhrA